MSRQYVELVRRLYEMEVPERLLPGLDAAADIDPVRNLRAALEAAGLGPEAA